jgi:hypothetical protein
MMNRVSSPSAPSAPPKRTEALFLCGLLPIWWQPSFPAGIATMRRGVRSTTIEHACFRGLPKGVQTSRRNG